MAAFLGLSVAQFMERHVRTVPDPREGPGKGEPRLALAEYPDGRCALLEGRNECRVYGVRPMLCRAFPYWPSVLGGGEGLERARATCPGLVVRPPEDQRRSALARFDALVAACEDAWAAESGRFHSDSTCTRPAAEDGEHFVRGLEAEWVLARADPPVETALRVGDCPWRSGAPSFDSGAEHSHSVGEIAHRCAAGPGRPLACRLRAHFRGRPEREEHAAVLVAELERLVKELDWPSSYGRLFEEIASRTQGNDVAEAKGSGVT